MKTLNINGPEQGAVLLNVRVTTRYRIRLRLAVLCMRIAAWLAKGELRLDMSEAER